jgi:membrane-bound metal-dependent hydrolase YbcI (DUF457 family)
MLLKTHLAFALFIILLMLSHIQEKILFVILFLIATILPDLETLPSHFSKVQAHFHEAIIAKHHSPFHSLTFGLLISIPFLFIYPAVAFPIFLGFGVHLILDMFTSQGVRIWWPSEKIIKGPVITGGLIEQVIFYTVVILDVIWVVPQLKGLMPLIKP